MVGGVPPIPDRRDSEKDLYGISIAFANRSVDHSLFVRLISYKPSAHNCAKLTDAEYRCSAAKLLEA